MRKLIHVSDLHFGKSDNFMVERLVEAMQTLAPHLVIISGDVTQRARPREFERAQEYFAMLRRAKLPFFVVPGNHDITPLYRPMKRIFNTFGNYKKYVSEQTEPFFADMEIAVASINSVTAVRPSGGRFRRKEAERASAWLSQFPDSMVKIVVTHHPVHAPNEKRTKRALGIRKMLGALEESGVDLFLAGHYHRSLVFPLAERFENHGALAVQAGTVSKRLRGELPAFNVLTIDKPNITIAAHRWLPRQSLFQPAESRHFFFAEGKWAEATF